MVSEALRPMIGPAYLLHGLVLPTRFAPVGCKLHSLDPEATG